MCEREKFIHAYNFFTLRIETWGESREKSPISYAPFINKIAKKSGFCYPFRHSSRPKRRGERKREARLKRERKLKTSGARTRGGPPRRSRDRLCAQRCGSRWRRALLAGDISVASKLRLRVDVCIVGGARLDLPSRLRERLSFFFPLFPSVSVVRACVSLSLSLLLPFPRSPSLSFVHLSLSVNPRVSAACVVARACRSPVFARVTPGWCLVLRYLAHLSRVCSERGGDYHAVAKW